MSSGSEWRVVSPAPRVAALALARPRARVRRTVLAQLRGCDSLAIYLGDTELALVMLARHGWRRTEMALAISPAAAPHMARLVRFARLTLERLAETRLIVAFVHPANPAGQRMAALTGFRPARLRQPGYWVYRRRRHGCPDGAEQAGAQGA